MKRLLTVFMVLALFAFGFSTFAMAEDKATPKEVVEKVKQAVAMFQEKSDEEGIAVVKDKNGPFVWKDTFLFIINYEGVIMAYPLNPKLEGRNMMPVKDANGKLFNAEAINMAKNNGQGWVDYHWVKPGETTPTLKASYVMAVPGKNFYVGGGIYGISKEDAEKAAQ